MSSVVFIIRVPFEENRENLKTGEGRNKPENLKENKEERISEQNDDENSGKNVNGVSLEENNERNIKDKTSTVDEVEPRDKTNEAEQTEDDVETLTDLNLAEVLQNELRALNVQGDSWTITSDKQFHQVIFLEKTDKIEKILERLTHVGVGKRPKTSVSIIPTSVHIQPQKNEYVSGKTFFRCQSYKTATATINDDTQSDTDLLIENNNESMKDQFKKSIKSRLTVEQVVEGVRSKAYLTFDFVIFTVVASLIAAVGLAENNAVVLVASMLVSPLMGPILGGTFGTVIKNKSLRNTGIKTELCGLTLSLVVGLFFGFICGPFGLNEASWVDSMIWPTREITSRGLTRSLWVGVLIALPSGAGVALSVLGGNIRSLVGVAISATLLVPAVNSGILWAYSIITAIKPPELLDSNEYNNSTSKCPPFKDNSYIPTYSCNMATEAAIMAVISLVLTIVNIICIFITATIVLKIKEVTPKASSCNATKAFWTEDVKVAREAYETFKGDQATDLLKQWKAVQESSKASQNSVLENAELLNIVEEVEKTEEFESVVRRAPRGAQHLHKFSRNLKRLVSRESLDDNHDTDDQRKAEIEAEILQNQLRNLQTYYTVQSQGKENSPHVAKIFSYPEIKPNNPEPKQKTREFHVVDTEKPHHTSVVRVQAPSNESNTYSIRTESGV